LSKATAPLCSSRTGSKKDGQQTRLRPGPTTRIASVQTLGYSGHAGHPQFIRRITPAPAALANDVTLRCAVQPE